MSGHNLEMRTVARTILLISVALGIAFQLGSCGGQCGFAQRVGWPECRDLANANPKPKKPVNSNIPPKCSTAPGGVNDTVFRYSMNCPAGSASNCNVAANNAGYVIVVVPDNGGQAFTPPSGVVPTIADCDGLLAAIQNPPDPTMILQTGDITGIVQVPANSAGFSMPCTASGCVRPPTASAQSRCLATWDPVAQAPSNTASNAFAPGTNYLMCAYIDFPKNSLFFGSGVPFLYTVGGATPTHNFIPFTYAVGAADPALTPPLLGDASGVNQWGDY